MSGMRWSREVRDWYRALATTPDSELDGPERVVRAALRRADDYAADTLSGLVRLRGPDDAEAAGGPSQAPQAGLPLKMLLVKPVGDLCNLACRYCYELQRRTGASGRTMEPDVLRRILRHTLPHVRPPFLVYVHGGEPLLRGREFFQVLVEEVRMLGGSEIGLGVQTNATTLDREWARFFRDHDFQVGLSLDGGRTAHDRNRVDRKGRGTYDRVLAGLELLREADVEFGTTSVLTADHAATEGAAVDLFESFRELGIRRYDVHPAFAPIPQSQPFNVSPKGYAGFMADLFDRWLREGDPQIRIRSFDHFFQSMTGVRANACYRSGTCTSIMGVDPGGEAVPCTRPFSSTYDFGNLAEEPLPRLIKRATYRRFVRDEGRGRKRTEDCRWSALCGQGSCPHERLDSEGDQAVDGRHYYCTCPEGEGGYPALYSHLIQGVRDILCLEPTVLASSPSSSPPAPAAPG